jgi:hypothetical protein
MESKQFVNSFKENISNWKSKMGTSNKFVKVYNEYINIPEG